MAVERKRKKLSKQLPTKPYVKGDGGGRRVRKGGEKRGDRVFIDCIYRLYTLRFIHT